MLGRPQMRTLISTAFVSLDGVVEAPGGEPGYRNSGWTFKDVEFLPEAYEIKGREQKEAAAMLLGRVSYEAFSPVWPGMAEFADYKVMPKYVVSTTLGEGDLVSDWGETTILRSLDEVAALKETEGGPIIMHGSATLNRALSDAGLIDRYHLLVFPLLLGAGKRLFSDTDKDAQKLKLVEHEAYANGIQKNVFDVVR
ncbi:dihydrofolate reductase family protein [Actinomadura montaniterrae]|uniref:Dihydrofolate reductase family protein n=2 Tax=Actinomadura montaniterrae TaxID=1803903 RepID=A0A6L3VMB5_9ACTN|nr:dihydrofolate reductase family protein [Actinomadura montaniterrae]